MKTKLRKSIDATFYNGLFDIFIKSLTTGPLLTAYALSFGIGNIMLGFLQSVVPFSNIIHLFVSYFLEKGKSVKKIACISSLLSRPLLILIAISFFFQENIFGIFLFVSSYVLFYSLVAVTGGAFWPWCKEFIPKSLTTSFFACRIRYILLVKILTVTAATGFLSFINKNYPSEIVYIYAFFFLLAFIAGLFYTYTLFQMHDVELQNIKNVSFNKKIGFILKNTDFRKFFISIGFINFTLSFFTPFSIVFLLKDLMLSVPTSIFFSIGSSCVDILFVNFWKKQMHQRNLNKILPYIIFLFVIAICFLIFVSVYKVYIYPILTLSFILIGISGSGINLFISDISISYIPSKMSSIYISLTNIGRFGFSGIGSLLAGMFIEILGYYTSYKWTLFFIFSAVFFILSGFFISKIKPIKN